MYQRVSAVTHPLQPFVVLGTPVKESIIACQISVTVAFAAMPPATHLQISAQASPVLIICSACLCIAIRVAVPHILLLATLLALSWNARGRHAVLPLIAGHDNALTEYAAIQTMQQASASMIYAKTALNARVGTVRMVSALELATTRSGVIMPCVPMNLNV